MKLSLHRALLALLLTAQPALAGLDVYRPSVEKGRAEIEYKGNRFGDSELDNTQSHKLELGYGFTDNLALALLLEGERDVDHSLHQTGTGLEAIYELTEQGDWWLSSGIYAEYMHAMRDGSADDVEMKALLERRQGPVDIVANIIAERQIGAEREHGVEIESVVQATYSLNSYFNPGVEWVAGWGNTKEDFDDQEHYLGPVITGDLVKFETRGYPSEIEYNLGYLWGLTDDSADNAIRFELEYELYL